MGKARRSWIRGIEVVNGRKYLVKACDQGDESKTPGGIIMPDTAKEDWTKYGRIFAEGDGEYDATGVFRGCKYALGDFIFFDRYTGRVVVDGVEYRQVGEDLITAKVDAAELGLDTRPVLMTAEERGVAEAAE